MSKEIYPVTLDRISATLKEFGVTVDTVTDPVNGAPLAGARLHGVDMSFLLFADSFIIRADKPTGESAANPSPRWYLAANRHNSVPGIARAAIIDRTEELILRLDVETDVKAGLSDAQLKTVVARGVMNLLNISQGFSQFLPGDTPETDES